MLQRFAKSFTARAWPGTGLGFKSSPERSRAVGMHHRHDSLATSRTRRTRRTGGRQAKQRARGLRKLVADVNATGHPIQKGSDSRHHLARGRHPDQRSPPPRRSGVSQRVSARLATRRSACCERDGGFSGLPLSPGPGRLASKHGCLPFPGVPCRSHPFCANRTICRTSRRQDRTLTPDLDWLNGG